MAAIQGTCNHCGKCCLPPIMLENPCIELGEDRCKFYVDKLNDQKYGHCLIYGRGNKPITVVRDRFNKKITPEQIEWFNDNCPNYPTIFDMENGAQLLPGCSFSFEAVIDA